MEIRNFLRNRFRFPLDHTLHSEEMVLVCLGIFSNDYSSVKLLLSLFCLDFIVRLTKHKVTRERGLLTENLLGSQWPVGLS